MTREVHLHGDARGVVIGDHNTVSIQYPEVARPFLAPPRASLPLVGRDDVLNECVQCLVRGELVVVEGLPGVGKSALAAAVAHHPAVLAHFADGVLWAGLGPDPDVDAELMTWAFALGAPVRMPCDRETLGRAVRAAVGLRRLLIIVDDAWTAEAAQMFRVGGPSTATLLTTRLPRVASELSPRPVVIEELSDASARQLLVMLAPDAGVSEATLAELVEVSGRIPLALQLIGHQLRHGSRFEPAALPGIIGGLSEKGRILSLSARAGVLDHRRDAATTLMAVIGASVEPLAESAKRTLAALSLLRPKPATFTSEMATTAAGTSAVDLVALHEAGLIEAAGRRYTIHQMIAAYARSLFADDGAVDRLVAFTCDLLVRHHRNGAVIGPEREQIVEALAYARQRAPVAAYCSAVAALSLHLEAQGVFQHDRDRVEDALQLAQAAGDDLAMTSALCASSRLAMMERRHADAISFGEAALAAAERCGDARKRAAAGINLSSAVSFRGDSARALELLTCARDTARDAGAATEYLVALLNLAALANRRGDHGAALAYIEEAETIPERAGLDAYLVSLRAFHEAAAGHVDAARRHFVHAIQLANEYGNMPLVLSCRQSMAALLARGEGSIDAARAELFALLEEASASGHVLSVESIIRSLGDLESQAGHYREALGHYAECLRLAKTAGDHSRTSLLYQDIGATVANLGDMRAAAQFFETGLRIAEEHGSDATTAGLLQSAAICADTFADYERAERYYGEALTIAHRAGDLERATKIGCDLVEHYLQRAKLAEAERAFSQLAEVATRMGTPIARVRTLLAQAQLHGAHCRIAEARAAVDAALGLAGTTSEPEVLRRIERIAGELFGSA